MQDTEQIVVNRRFGGFCLSEAALDLLVEEYGFKTTGYNEDGEYANPDADIVDGQGKVTSSPAVNGGILSLIKDRTWPGGEEVTGVMSSDEVDQ